MRWGASGGKERERADGRFIFIRRKRRIEDFRLESEYLLVFIRGAGVFLALVDLLVSAQV